MFRSTTIIRELQCPCQSHYYLTTVVCILSVVVRQHIILFGPVCAWGASRVCVFMLVWLNNSDFGKDILTPEVLTVILFLPTVFFPTFLPPPPMPPHVLMNFRGFPPGCGDSVAAFWGWDAHEARLRCPDDVWVVICRKMKYQEGP
jgi:hypothetical protein